jgi:hypothetical protein
MVKLKHFAIKKTNRINIEPVYVAVPEYILPYTVSSKYIKRYLTREDAAKDLMHEAEVIVDLRHKR